MYYHLFEMFNKSCIFAILSKQISKCKVANMGYKNIYWVNYLLRSINNFCHIYTLIYLQRPKYTHSMFKGQRDLGNLLKIIKPYCHLSKTSSNFYCYSHLTAKLNNTSRFLLPKRFTSIALRITENGTHSSSPRAHQDSQLTIAHNPWAPSGRWSTIYNDAERICKQLRHGYIQISTEVAKN